MMLTIHGLPITINYPTLKSIIYKECKLSDFILGVIAHDTDFTKKVRIGVVDEREGNIIMKSLDGYKFSGHIFRVVPLGKSGNTSNERDSSWRGNQQDLNYEHQSNNSLTNRSGSWSQNKAQGGQWSNQQPMLAHIKNQGHSPFAQQYTNIPPVYQQQNEPHSQNKPFCHQERLIQAKANQSQSYTSNKDCQNSLGNRVNTSNMPQRNQPRPLMLANVELDEHMTNVLAQSGRFSSSSYANDDKPVTIKKEYFQGPSQYNAGEQSSQAQTSYQGQAYDPQWPAMDSVTRQKHSPAPYEKPYGKAMHSDNRQLHDHIKGADTKSFEYNQYEKTGRRMSPQRERITDRRQDYQTGRRISPPGHTISPSGHRIMHSGRTISPHRRDSPYIPQSGRRSSPERNISPTGRRYSSFERRYSPSGRHVPQFEHGMPSSERKINSDRRASPSPRRISPYDHRILSRQGISPSVRNSTPGRRVSPPGRRLSPSERRVSPSGRKMSPIDRRSEVDRRISPTGRRTLSAGPSSIHGDAGKRRLSPGHKGERYVGARMSPRRSSPNVGKQPSNRNRSPGVRSTGASRPSTFARLDQRGHEQRYSPPRAEKNMESLFSATDKDMRPSYNPAVQAQTQPMYAGDYLPQARDKQFQTTRPDQRPIWQDKEKGYSKPTDDRRDVPRNQKFDGPRSGPRPHMGQSEKLRSPERMSRSPNRRDRSPVRDRFRRHSPSPRSPRRSWALEKRRSPEATDVPPPPIWPMKETYGNINRSNIKRTRWEKPYEEKASQSMSHTDGRRSPERADRHHASTSRQWKPKSSEPEREKPREHSPRARHNERYSNQNETRDYDSRRRDEYKRHPQHEHKHYANHDIAHYKSTDYRQIDERKPDLRIAQNLNSDTKVFKTEPEFHHPKKHESKPYYGKVKLEPNKHSRGTRSSHDPHEIPGSHNRDPVQSRPVDPYNVDLNPKVQYKRDRAVDEIAGKLLHKFAPELKGTIRDKVEERVKQIIESMVRDMFGVKDASFIEIVIQFEDKHSRDLEGIFDNVLSEFPVEVRRLKRPATDDSHIPAKISRDSTSSRVNKDQPFNQPNISGWHFDPMVTPIMVQQIPIVAQVPTMPISSPMSERMPEPMLSETEDGHCLYMCKESFQPFTENQATCLRNFIVNKIFAITETDISWSPDLTLRGIRNETRYEVETRDDISKDWLLSLDFTEFSYFNVIIHFPGESSYERAAIWLPGHLRTQILSPLFKLKLQNRCLSDVSIGKWKLVRQIVTQNGTRLYVDMPSFSARALAQYDMSLSYEVQKVNVYLKSAAADEDTFDVGLKAKSITVVPDVFKQNMPALNMQDLSVVKFCFANKTINVTTAWKIKDLLVQNIYKYLLNGGTSKMGFLKHGFSKPGYFCVVPEDEATRLWINSVDFGQINGQRVIVLGEDNCTYFSVMISIPNEKYLSPKNVLEKFKRSNRGESGLKFHLWKNAEITPAHKMRKLNYRVDVDIESIEALFELGFILYYSIETRTEPVHVNTMESKKYLKKVVNEYRTEAKDKLDVVNMDISAADSDNDVACVCSDDCNF